MIMDQLDVITLARELVEWALLTMFVILVVTQEKKRIKTQVSMPHS